MAGVAFTPEGGGVAVWDLVARRTALLLDADEEQTSALAWSPDGRALVTGGVFGLARAWDAASGERQSEWRAHERGLNVTGLAFLPGGRELVSCGEDGEVKVWAWPGGRPVRTLKHKPV